MRTAAVVSPRRGLAAGLLPDRPGDATLRPQQQPPHRDSLAAMRLPDQVWFLMCPLQQQLPCRLLRSLTGLWLPLLPTAAPNCIRYHATAVWLPERPVVVPQQPQLAPQTVPLLPTA